MSKRKEIEKAIKEAHESADRAIDELQEDLEETRGAIMKWLHTERPVKNSELLAVGLCVILTLMVVGNF